MKRKILRINNMCEEKVPEALLEKAVCAVFLQEGVGKNKEISLALVPSHLMRELNVKYRGKDFLTDVLAFPLDEKIGPARKVLGEIVICPSVAKAYAKEQGHSLEDELVLLVVHGTLHLFGYTDEEDDKKKLMQQKEKEIIHTLEERSKQC
ncbi:rRNA maturation RNase YbeY [Candidatus Aerophobetes bacterium]|nr:rRNA maturation RNase YbeY [Candidatus Aerophobetes bacterium]